MGRRYSLVDKQKQGTNQPYFGGLLEDGGPWPWLLDFHAPTKHLISQYLVDTDQHHPTRFHLHVSLFPLEIGGQTTYMETHP